MHDGAKKKKQKWREDTDVKSHAVKLNFYDASTSYTSPLEPQPPSFCFSLDTTPFSL